MDLGQPVDRRPPFRLGHLVLAEPGLAEELGQRRDRRGVGLHQVEDPQGELRGRLPGLAAARPLGAACCSNRAQQATIAVARGALAQQLQLVGGVVAAIAAETRVGRSASAGPRTPGRRGACRRFGRRRHSCQSASPASATSASAPSTTIAIASDRAGPAAAPLVPARPPSVGLPVAGRGLRWSGSVSPFREPPKPSPSTTVPGPIDAAQVTSRVTNTVTHATATAAARRPPYGAAGLLVHGTEPSRARRPGWTRGRVTVRSRKRLDTAKG